MSAQSNGIGTPGRNEPCEEHSMLLCRLCNRTVKAPFGSTRSPLKKSQGSTRHIRQRDYLALVGKAKSDQRGRCIGHIVDVEHECEGPFDAMHMVDQQRIVTVLGEGSEALTDNRLVVYGCRFIHGSFDNWSGDFRDPEDRAHLMRAAHPGLKVAVRHYGLEAELDRKIYGA